MPLHNLQHILYFYPISNRTVPICPQSQVSTLPQVYLEHFDPFSARPLNLQYILFGTKSEVHADHLLSVAPDFMQVQRLPDCKCALPETVSAENLEI